MFFGYVTQGNTGVGVIYGSMFRGGMLVLNM